MIVAHKNNVETGNLLGNQSRRIFVPGCFSGHTTVGVIDAGMKQSDQQIRSLLFLNDPDPLFGRLNHILKFHTFPDFFRKPVWNPRGDQTKDRDSYPSFFEHGIWREIGITGFGIDRVRRQPREIELVDKFVVNRMPGFDVVIADRAGFVSHVVQDFGHDMRRVGFLEIVIIHHRLSLQEISAI